MDSTMCGNPLESYLHTISWDRILVKLFSSFFWGFLEHQVLKGIREENNFLVGLVKVG